MDVEFDISHVCRACEGSTDLKIVDSVPGLHQFFKNYMNIDPLPRQEAICDTCLKLINNFKEFESNCKQTDTKIRNWLAEQTVSLNNNEAYTEVAFVPDNNAEIVDLVEDGDQNLVKDEIEIDDDECIVLEDESSNEGNWVLEYEDEQMDMIPKKTADGFKCKKCELIYKTRKGYRLHLLKQ